MQGEPYCAMGIAFCYMKAFAFLTGQPTDNKTLKSILSNDLPHYFNPSPSCGAIVTFAKQQKIWRPFEDASSILPGDLVLFSFSKSTPRRAQHIGIFDHASKGQVVCVEFNTSAGAAGSQADGQGCFVRQRNPSSVLGSVRVNRPAEGAVVASKSSVVQPVPSVEELKIVLLADNRVIACHAVVEEGRMRVDLRPICEALNIALPADNALQDLQPTVIPPGVTRVDLRPLVENNGWELRTHRMAEDHKIYLRKQG